MQIASLSKQIESSELENQEASTTNFHQQTTDPHHPIKQFENWIEESAVVGLWDVLKKYSYFRAEFSQFLRQLQEEKPEAIILIDYPGFNLRLAQAIRRRKLPIKIFYYISPQVWAWNKNRIPKMARLLDLMICIFPFEKELYESSGLPTTFAGHPLVETIMASQKETPPLLRETNLLGLFPGSREREVRHLFPIMLQAFRELTQVDSKIRCEAAAATPHLAAIMQSMVQEVGVSISVTIGKAPELMQRATFGLVCSGTATLEAACYALPYALVYKVAWLTYVVGKQLIRVPFLGIINILAGHLIVREFIQREATPRALAEEALRYLTHPQACEQLSKQLTKVISTLHGQGAYDKAAATMISAL
jgi:lipid-A-disaccharide synthase